MWDRAKQNYWILRYGDPWKVISSKTNETICDYPAHNYDMEATEKICFAENDEEVKKIVKGLE